LKGHWDADRDPLVALHNGDPAPFEDFVRSEAGTLIAFFVHLGAERSEAEDLAQETFVKLYKSATHYEPRAAFSSYALRVARNAWIDRRRRAAVRPGGVSLDAQDDDGGGAPLGERLTAPASDVLAPPCPRTAPACASPSPNSRPRTRRCSSWPSSANCPTPRSPRRWASRSEP
jgi:RNA polymerase sigma factor (sigma-70 family)